MSNGIKDKVVLITGGSSGIGAASAKYLAARGAIVALAARRKDKLDSLVSEITGFGGKAKAFFCDVTKKEHVKSVVDAVVAEHGRLDVIVNNAGIMPVRPIQECNTDEWDAMVDINIKGLLYGIAAALPIFMKQDGGQFINISSIAAVKVFAPGGTVYSGTKFAVRAISDGLRLEVGPKSAHALSSPDPSTVN
jgi:NADP-dependent 3-hydroxy acid dehydrogenase YdfG